MPSTTFKILPKSTNRFKSYYGFLCAHLTCLNVRQFGVVEATGFKNVASRSSSITCLPYFMKIHQWARKLLWGTHRQTRKDRLVTLEAFFHFNEAKKNKAVPPHATKALVGRGCRAPTHSGPRHYLGCVVSVTTRPRFSPGKGPPVPIAQKDGWTPEPVWTQRLQEKTYASGGGRTSITRLSSR
jgi:hypothetical protein